MQHRNSKRGGRRMLVLFDRKIKIQTGAKSQTVNICTKENKFGTYEFTVRLHPPFFVKPDTLVPVGGGFF
jgi:hypothetical protein